MRFVPIASSKGSGVLAWECRQSYQLISKNDIWAGPNCYAVFQKFGCQVYGS